MAEYLYRLEFWLCTFNIGHSHLQEIRNGKDAGTNMDAIFGSMQKT